MNILTVIYDDRCGLCTAARKWAEPRCGETVFFYPASRAGRLMENRRIPPEAIRRGVIVVDGDSVHVGYAGVLRVLKRSGVSPTLLRLLRIPGLFGMGSLLYRYLARHRRLASRLLRLTPSPVETGTCHCGGGCV